MKNKKTLKRFKSSKVWPFH